MKKSLLIGLFVSLYCLSWVSLAQEKKSHIVFIPKSSDQVFWDLVRKGVVQAAQEDGNVQLTWRGPAHNDDTDSQIRVLQVYTRPDVDAILITPTDRSRLVEPVRAAKALGIKVVVVDSALDGDDAVNMVATDNLSGGRLAAKRMASLLNNQGSVIVLRTVLGSASTDERAEGFMAYLKENAPKITVVDDVHGGGSAGRLQHNAMELLKKHPTVQGVFAVNESATVGMLRAIRQIKPVSKIKFIGFDSTDFLIQALENQEIDGLVIQNPQQMGYLGVKAVMAAVRNAPLPNKAIFTATHMVTRENLKSSEIQKLICVRC